MLILIYILLFIAIFLLVIQLFPEKIELEKEEGTPGGLYRIFRPLIKYLAKYNAKIQLPEIKAGYKKKMEKAGFQLELTPDDFLAIKELTLIAGILFAIFVYYFAYKDIIVFLLGIVLGFFMPDLRLADAVKKREFAIMRAMPNFLDLLTLSVEAGLDFAGAVRKVIEKSRPNPLIFEFKLFLRELMVGKSRKEALRDMANKLEIPDISSFVSTIIQSEEAGASLGPVLRIQAEEMRAKRFQRAEKLASQAPVKMLFPLIAFIFPATFIMLFGPLYFQFKEMGGF
ncbi:MAG: type II secretion system F family protein [candidate division WOR-3 bacterium]